MKTYKSIVNRDVNWNIDDADETKLNHLTCIKRNGKHVRNGRNNRHTHKTYRDIARNSFFSQQTLNYIKFKGRKTLFD